MGAWLAHVNLFRKVPFYIDICRAEAASIEGTADCLAILLFAYEIYDDLSDTRKGGPLLVDSLQSGAAQRSLLI